MAMVGVVNGSQLAPNYIHQMNRVNSRNDFVMTTALSSQFWLSSCQKPDTHLYTASFLQRLLYQKTACACCLRMMRAGSCIVFLCKLVTMSGPRASCAVLFLPSYLMGLSCMYVYIYNTTKQQTI